jgi:hypothetical protein
MRPDQKVSRLNMRKLRYCDCKDERLIPSTVSSFSMYTVIPLFLPMLEAPPNSVFGIPNSSVKKLFPHNHILLSYNHILLSSESRKKSTGVKSGKKESSLTVFG